MTVTEAPCVLVVEDEIMISMLLEDRLEQAGYRVLVAATWRMRWIWRVTQRWMSPCWTSTSTAKRVSRSRRH